MQRAQALIEKAPEVAEKVAAGEISLNAAERQAQGEDIDERFTPRSLVTALHRAYDFSVDATAHPLSPATQVIGKGWTKADDFLKQKTKGARIFMNPMFSALDECVTWIDHAVRSGGAELALMVLPVRTDQPWWHKFIEPNRDRGGWQFGGPHRDGVLVSTRFLEGRTRFGYPGDPEGEKAGSPNFWCALVLWARNPLTEQLRGIDFAIDGPP